MYNSSRNTHIVITHTLTIGLLSLSYIISLAVLYYVHMASACVYVQLVNKHLSNIHVREHLQTEFSMLNVIVTLSSDPPPPLLLKSHLELVLPDFCNKIKQLIATSYCS